MDKFYIIGIRDNPQLGSYLSKVIVAKPKINKTCITAKFEEYGEATSLRFTICPCTVDGRHYCMTKQNCIYGGYTYFGYSDKSKAKAELESWLNSKGSSAARAEIGLQLIEKN